MQSHISRKSRRCSSALAVYLVGVALVLVSAISIERVYALGSETGKRGTRSFRNGDAASQHPQLRGRKFVGVAPFEGKNSYDITNSEDKSLLQLNYEQRLLEINDNIGKDPRQRVPKKALEASAVVEDYWRRLAGSGSITQKSELAKVPTAQSGPAMVTNYMTRLTLVSAPSKNYETLVKASKASDPQSAPAMVADYASRVVDMPALSGNQETLKNAQVVMNGVHLRRAGPSKQTLANGQVPKPLRGGGTLKRTLIMTQGEPNEKALIYSKEVEPVRVAALHTNAAEKVASSSTSGAALFRHATAPVEKERIAAPAAFWDVRKIITTRKTVQGQKYAALLALGSSLRSAVEVAVVRDKFLMALAGVMVFLVGVLVPALVVLPFKRRLVAAAAKARAGFDAEPLRESCMEMGMDEQEYKQLLTEHLRSEPSGSVRMEERSSSGAGKLWHSLDVMSFITGSSSSSSMYSAAPGGAKLADRVFEMMMAMSNVTRSKSSAPLVDIESGGEMAKHAIEGLGGYPRVKTQHTVIPVTKMFSSPAVYDSSRMFESREKVLGVAVGDELV